VIMIVLVALLLAYNLTAAHRATRPPTRVRRAARKPKSAPLPASIRVTPTCQGGTSAQLRP